MLRIEDLRAAIDGRQILQGLNLSIDAGEVHAIMGPNGSGKSTLSAVLTGKEGYEVSGKVTFEDENLLEMLPEQRAVKGIFLAFQYPVEIPGVGNMYFLRTAVNAIRRERGEPEIDAVSFLGAVKQQMAELDMDPGMLSRSVNAGFSGGEKKRNEVLQMAMLQPKLAILDETDSGLDIDALRLVAGGVQRMRSPERSMLIITHYPRLLEYVVPDYVHVLSKGRIIRTGDASLAQELEVEGYRGTEASLAGAVGSASGASQ